MAETLLHGLPAQVDARCRVLVLGSMPGAASLQEARYYAHPRNRFWPLMGALCGFDPQLEYARRIENMQRAGIGLWDVIGQCRRRGSLDADIVRGSEVPNPLPELIARLPQLVERAGNGAAGGGSITAFYTVLTEGDDQQDPIADSARAITDSQIRLQVTLSTPQYSELERAREVASHSHFGAPMGEVIGILATDYLDRKDPLRKESHAETPAAAPERTGRRPIPQNIRRLVFQRADGRCEYKNPHTGQTCGSRFQTQIDHIKPVALGGTNAVENLRLLCRAHNAWSAEEIFGPFVKN